MGNHGGVAAYVRSDLIATRRDDLELDTVEGMWLEIAVPKSCSLLIGNFYRPDRTSPYYDKDFMKKLSDILDTASAEGKELLLFGDFNSCFMSSHRNNSDCKQLKSLFRSMNIKQLIDKPTRITKDLKSLIDLVAANCPQNVCNSGVVSAHLIDHELTYCVRKMNGKKAPSQLKTFRNYANFNVNAFRKDLEGVTWSNTSTPDGPNSVDQLWHDFERKFVNVADSHAPLIQRRVRGVDNCPWLNKNIKANMRQREYFHKKAKKTDRSEDWANYRHFRNRVTKDMRKAKASYNRRVIDESGGDHRSLWRTMKKILPGEKKPTSPNVKIDGALSSDKQSIANAFNNFFATAAGRLMGSLRSACAHSQRSPKTLAKKNTPFKFEEISENVILSQLRSLKTGKAVGLDHIPSRLLKDSTDIVATPLAHIINPRSLLEKIVTRSLEGGSIGPPPSTFDTIHPIDLKFGTHSKLHLYFKSSETTWCLISFHGNNCQINDVTGGRHLGFSNFQILFKFSLLYLRLTGKQHLAIEIHEIGRIHCEVLSI